MELPHTYIIGQSGTGKSTLLKHYILEAMHAGHGLIYLDPHGHDTDDLLQYIPPAIAKRVLLYDPTEFPLAWNPLADIPPEQQPFIASTFVDTIKSAWGYDHMPTPTMDMFLYFSLTAIMQAGGTIVDMIPLLTDTDFRQTIRDKQTDPIIKDFWERFDSKDYSGKERRQETASTLNKLYVLCGDPRIRQTLNHAHSSFTMQSVLEDNRVLLARLPQGKLGIGKAALIGSLLLSQAHISALSRSSRVPFHFFIDEGHEWGSATVASLLSGIRKFACQVTFAHQYVGQLDRSLYTALMGNCAVRHVFRVSTEDAETFQSRFGRNANFFDLDQIPNYTYRTFPFDHHHGDDTVLPINRPAYPERKRKIEQAMRLRYLRGKAC